MQLMPNVSLWMKMCSISFWHCIGSFLAPLQVKRVYMWMILRSMVNLYVLLQWRLCLMLHSHCSMLLAMSVPTSSRMFSQQLPQQPHLLPAVAVLLLPLGKQRLSSKSRLGWIRTMKLLCVLLLRLKWLASWVDYSLVFSGKKERIKGLKKGVDRVPLLTLWRVFS